MGVSKGLSCIHDPPSHIDNSVSQTLDPSFNLVYKKNETNWKRLHIEGIRGKKKEKTMNMRRKW